MPEVSVQCKFPDCNKELEISKGMKYCPYCGASFELYGTKTDDLFILRRDYGKLKDKQSNQSLGLFFIVLFVTASILGSFFNISKESVYLISVCLATGPSILIYFKDEKELKQKFPQFYKP